jgi:anti-sigma regulatory factor (Ser/Thr protein kinase)
VVARWRGKFLASPEAAHVIRGEMAAIARECGLSDEQVGDVKLAVSEAATNAIQHAYAGREPGDVAAAAYVENGKLRIVISDEGQGIQPRVDSPGLGLGLPLIASVASSVDVVSEGSGTEIHITFPCPASQAA